MTIGGRRARQAAALGAGLLLAGGGTWLAFGPVPAPGRAGGAPVAEEPPPEQSTEPWCPAIPDEPVVRGESDAELLARVISAISTALGWLLETDADGARAVTASARRAGDSGAVAFAYRTSLEAGANRFDERLDFDHTWLRLRWRSWIDGGHGPAGPWSTADCALALRALCARGLWQPMTMRGPAASHRLNASELAWGQELHAELIKHVVGEPSIAGDARSPLAGGLVQPGAPARRAPPAHYRDVVLGLHAASRLGIRTPPETWAALADAILAAQSPDGPPVVRIQSEFTPRWSEARLRPLPRFVDRARGWRTPRGVVLAGNRPIGGDETGVMTACALAALAVCWHHEDEAVRANRSPVMAARPRALEVERATHDGFAWLARHWSIEGNSGSGRWNYSSLDALAEAAVLNGRAFIGVHDWYREGCEHLLATQRADGSWDDASGDGPLASTCFAVRFLARATPPLARPR